MNKFYTQRWGEKNNKQTKQQNCSIGITACWQYLISTRGPKDCLCHLTQRANGWYNNNNNGIYCRAWTGNILHPAVIRLIDRLSGAGLGLWRTACAIDHGELDRVCIISASNPGVFFHPDNTPAPFHHGTHPSRWPPETGSDLFICDTLLCPFEALFFFSVGGNICCIGIAADCFWVHTFRGVRRCLWQLPRRRKPARPLRWQVTWALWPPVVLMFSSRWAALAPRFEADPRHDATAFCASTLLYAARIGRRWFALWWMLLLKAFWFFFFSQKRKKNCAILSPEWAYTRNVITVI